jgi:hypothetical protein
MSRRGLQPRETVESPARTEQVLTHDVSLDATAAEILTWLRYGIPILAVIGLVLGIVGVIYIALLYNADVIHPDGPGPCADGNPATIDMYVGKGTSVCAHYDLPSGSPCTGEQSCFASCIVQNGTATGTCLGEDPPTYYNVFPPDCPIPIFMLATQFDIYGGQLFYFRDSILGKCRTYVQYTLGDMVPTMGHDSEAFFNPNNLNRLDYDKDREHMCMGLISDQDPYRMCYQAIVLWMWSSAQDSDVFLCEFTYTCATHRTFNDADNTPDNVFVVDTKTTTEKLINHVKKSSKRGTSDASLVPNPDQVSSFFFPRAQIQNQLAGNATAVKEWWDQAPDIPANRSSWPRGRSANMTRPSLQDLELTIRGDPPVGSPQWCILQWFSTSMESGGLGLNLTVLNQTIYGAFQEGFTNVPLIFSVYYYGDEFADEPDQLYYFYSYMFFLFQLGDLCPCC